MNVYQMELPDSDSVLWTLIGEAVDWLLSRLSIWIHAGHTHPGGTPRGDTLEFSQSDDS